MQLSYGQFGSPVDVAMEPTYDLPDITVMASRLPQQEPVQVERAQGVDLNALMQRYLSAPAEDYSGQLRAASAQRKQAATAFDDYLKGLAAQPEQSGPSKAEMYFRLAAAFGAPTKTGSFIESLGTAGKEMAGYVGEQRAAQLANAQRQQGLNLERLKLAMQGAKDEETTLRALAAEDVKDRRALMTEYLKSGRPQSEAGKAAADLGLVPGTEQHNDFIRKYIEDKVSSGNLYREAMVAIARGNLGLAQQKERRAVETAGKLSPKEVDLRIETEDLVNTATSAEQLLQQALELNPKTFSGSLADMAQRKALEMAGSDSPRLQATRDQENILASQAVSQLKALVGGNPTEGERAIILDLQGIGAKTLAEREAIIKRSLTAVQRRRQLAQQRLKEIKSGAMRETTGATE